MLDVTGDVDADAFKSIEGVVGVKSSLIVDKEIFICSNEAAHGRTASWAAF